ncbi:MAG TPA: DUF3043 domain-containing protein [Ornithinimicrobium sp.]|uniref:DUF3043 domain-containing protein n=1 Tax=Ornithinimicrobium sp. TaxID=1977084 RepID=UPI002B4A772A|nr:DUF3043 domain-containing protein [Ornithinimicrobium sp.]HKJ11913.1 DUF3043 domain-containing protein [Ornithinimicrobium sp.]
MPLFKKPEAAEEHAAAVHTETTDSVGGKGRPTPKRREAQAARRRPLVADTRGASREEKLKRKRDRAVARDGMLRGQEKYLPARDRGPQRRYLRDAVDRRWNIGEVLLPTMLIILAASLINVPGVQLAMFAGAYGLIFFGLFDAVWLWRRTRKSFFEEFGTEPAPRSGLYVVLRSFQMRMSRVPRPQVQRGEPLRRR